MVAPVWLITGCTAGFGAEFAMNLLSRGCKVIATGRKIEALGHLKELGAHIMSLDVTAHESVLKEKAIEAMRFEGRIDGLVNNAGYAVLGTMEEMKEEDLNKQFKTNLHGQSAVTRAFLPYLQEQKGKVVFISSFTSTNVVPAAGAYCVSKGGLDTMARSFQAEQKQFGVEVFLVTPGYFGTRIMQKESIGETCESLNSSEIHYDTSQGGVPNHLPKYNAMRADLAHHLKTKSLPGDPAKAAQVMFDIILREGHASGGKPPFQIVLGKDAYDSLKAELEQSLRSLEAWRFMTTSTDFDQEQQ